MKLNIQTPKQSLNKAFLKQPVNRDEIDLFKTNLQILLDKINPNESEEHHKNFVRDFLKSSFYKADYEINTKGRQDLVIHSGKTAQEKVGVILEAKKPANKADMISADNPNRKALHELILYYLNERNEADNFELKNLVITDIYQWFIFDANVFDKVIYRNTQIKRLYQTYKADKKDNPFFYGELQKIIASLDETIDCAVFDISDYQTALNNDDDKDDVSLIELFKILSPNHLLKVPFADDSNKLDKNFYTELLHIIGLEEIKDKSKLKIQRKDEARRDAGSLIENAIAIIETKDCLYKVKNLESYGETREERLFGVALELCLTWINRVLFLKLLEAQLVDYHNGDREYRFLDAKTIQDFDELFTLFHQVLAKLPEERRANIKAKYSRVPYLNSSLFEISELENDTVTIESLKDTIELPFNNSSILKDGKQKGLPTMVYLFAFLDAYDFASEGASTITENNRSLINASVLGKVFEKINGYKDGSIYTPGFITMYMCRQSIRLAVVQKFKDAYGWNIAEFADIKNYLADRKSKADILEFNHVINSLHLCDPAVGSGHFLVSSLNEIIAIKGELGILADASGERFRDIEITIENDELTVFDTERSEFFKYRITNGTPASKEAQRLQKTLFHEKQTLIENCLFGVDINPNSVKICRLRLWIELLKNAYYKEIQKPARSKGADDDEERPYFVRASANEYTELETLPNIDINIKEGNSLLSRFALDADLTQILKQIKYNIEDYRNFVLGYKETRDREKKREFEAKIKQIKDDFKTQLFFFSPERRKLADLENQLKASESKQFLFGESDEEKAKRFKNEETLRAKIKQAKETVRQIEENAIYKNAFEWRFEFPEVLDNDGNFTGFDIVIGNPPYIRQEELGTLKDYLKKDYEVYTGTADILVYFYELGLRVLKQNGKFSFITSNKFMRANYGKPLRSFLGNYNLDEIIDFGDAPVFGGIAAYASIVNLQKCRNTHEVNVSPEESRPYSVRASASGGNQTRVYTFPISGDVSDFEASYKADSFKIAQTELTPNGWRLEQTDVLDLLAKLRSKGEPLGEYVNGRFYRGIITGFNEAFVIDRETKDRLIAEDSSSAEVIKPYLRGRDVKRWNVNYEDLYLIKIESSSNKKHAWSGKEMQKPARSKGADDDEERPYFVRASAFENEAEQIFSETYPAIYKHLQNFRANLIKRDDKGLYFWELRSCVYWHEFENSKIFYPDIYIHQSFAWDECGYFSGNTCYFIPTDEKWLTALLNSKTIQWFYSQISNKIRGGYLRAFSDYMKQIPIPKIEEKDQQPFVALVDRILELKKEGKDTQSLENEIDALVYRLYELTDEEIKIIEEK